MKSVCKMDESNDQECHVNLLHNIPYFDNGQKNRPAIAPAKPSYNIRFVEHEPRNNQHHHHYSALSFLRSFHLPYVIKVPDIQLPLEPQHSEVRLVWRDLSYVVRENSCVSPFRSPLKKTLIKNLNGSIKSGQLTAIIGPSGAGKTTLIECLAGRRIKGVCGEISVKYNGLPKSSLKISYYRQHDSLDEQLTVQESLRYALELRNCECKKQSFENDDFLLTFNSNDELEKNEKTGIYPVNVRERNQLIIQSLVDELHLNKCLNNLVSKCSGGQRRRLSIALELIFSPKILLLDEPTSGLDSLSSLQCIQTLKKLVDHKKSPMMIAASIHQPTAKIMSYFDNLYIISYNGYCIYNGPTKDLVSTLSSYGLNCPQYHNPADYVIEVATGDFGQDVILGLKCHFEHICLEQSKDSKVERTLNIKKLVKVTQKHSFWGQLLAVWVLTRRCLLTTYRDPNTYLARLITICAVLFIVFIMYKDNKVGMLDGCASKPTRQTLNQLQNFELFSFEDVYYANFGFLFFSVLFVVFITVLPTLLSFPLDVSVFIKENFNGWYSLKSYYIARNIADLPPTLFFPFLYGLVSFFFTHQLFELHRLFLFIFILIFVASLAQGLGFLVSAYFVKDVTTSTVVGGIINIPLFLFTGLLIKISSMPQYFQPLTYLSYFRLAFESLLVTIYGLDRCHKTEPITFNYLKSEFGEEILDMYSCLSYINPSIPENLTNTIDSYNEQFLTNITSSSMALHIFNYNDNTLWINVIYMAIYMIFLRLIAYCILHRKTTVR